jgi:long-chain fatty acid transport protein
MKRFLAASVLLCLGSMSAHAGGFQIPEMGIKAMGMGNAFTAVANDPSALWFNPAGIAFQQGTVLTVGGDVIFPKVDFTANASNPLAPASASMSRDASLVPHAYLAHTDDNLGISYGIGINSPFGLEVKWPTTAPFAAGTQYGRLQAINVNPNIAYKFTPNLSLAVGVDYVDMYNVDFNGTALIQNFKGDGWGANIAAMYHTDAFNIGISYRTSVKIKAKGTSTTLPPTYPYSTGANNITVTEPDMLNIGVAFHPQEDWTVSAEADWVDWKKFNQLAFTYSPALIIGSSLTVPENWKATWAYRLGAEWRFAPTMRVRAGYTYDPTPINDPYFTPLIPGNDRQAVHLGYGIDVTKHATIDLAYVYVWMKDRNQTQSTGTNVVRNGIYKTTINLAGASLTYRF